MKSKYIIPGIICILALVLVAGCAGMATVTKKVCNFDLADSQEAQQALDLIATAAPVAGTLAGVPITKDQAETILAQVINAAQQGGCVLLTDLQNALAYFDTLVSGNKALAAKKPKLLSLRAKALH